MVEKLMAFITKTEKLNFGLVILLWTAGAVLCLMNFPWIILGILAMHIPETLFIGIKTGKDNGDRLVDSIAKCMTYGFLWWVPVKYRLSHKD